MKRGSPTGIFAVLAAALRAGTGNSNQNPMPAGSARSAGNQLSPAPATQP